MNPSNKKRLKIITISFTILLFIPNLLILNIPNTNIEEIPYLKISALSVWAPTGSEEINLSESTSLYIEWSSGESNPHQVDIYLYDYDTQIEDLGRYASSFGTNSMFVSLSIDLPSSDWYRIKVDQVASSNYDYSWYFTIINMDDYYEDNGENGDPGGPPEPNYIGAIILISIFVIGALSIIGVGGVRTIKAINERKTLSSIQKPVIRKGTSTSLLKCRNCNSHILKRDKFCHRCGTPIY